ncbi:MAG: hypothetical protein IKR25_11340 [Muribaculaceae bacterium]|nr:hypothetical protein [Muribaculaceae bacterium]
MADYRVKYHVNYVGGTTDDFTEVIPQSKYSWYCDGAQGGTRLRQMAEARDFKGRKVHCVTMALQEIIY